MSEATKVLAQESGDGWVMYNADCVEGIKGIPDESVGYTITSVPFSSLYTYSNSVRDMGNGITHSEFFAHLGFLVDGLFRVTEPGRCCSVHCMVLPTIKQRDGHIGLNDFRGDLIRLFQSKGWIYASEVAIWKDPVTAMQRAKALGLFWKTIQKDSSMSRQGIADYLLTFQKSQDEGEALDLLPGYLVTLRKPGINLKPISHTKEEFPVGDWQNLASPVWMDIDPSDTLQYRAARESNDERHIVPLQLEVIRRGIRLWSRPGDVVLDPFGGIGSTPCMAIEMNRRGLAFELKPSYFRQAVSNLRSARRQGDLFAQPVEAEAAPTGSVESWSEASIIACFDGVEIESDAEGVGGSFSSKKDAEAYLRKLGFSQGAHNERSDYYRRREPDAEPETESEAE